jgi:SagB-type dehydrogenase family enzyme
VTEWAPVTTATPLTGETVELDSPAAGTRVRLNRDALARVIASHEVPAPLVSGLASRGLLCSDGAARSLPAEDLRTWQERGWGRSLSYYLWSRRRHFVDDGVEGQARRAATLTRMVEKEPCPEPSLPPHRETPLPALNGRELPSLGEALLRRRSVFRPRGGPLTAEALSILLRQGMRRATEAREESAAGGREITRLLTSYGSAHDVYVLVYECVDVDPGAYAFSLPGQRLLQVRGGDVRAEARTALLAHPTIDDAAATVVLVGDFSRYRWRYRHERALRNLWVDTGRIMQELLLTATALEMSTGLTPAVSDSGFCRLLGLDGRDVQALHTLTVSGPSRPGA